MNRTMDFLRDAARRSPDSPALVEGDRSWTWSELDGRADLLATGLMALGAGRGTTTASLLSDGPEAVTAVHAVPRTGAVLAPLNPRLTAPEVSQAVDTLGADVVLCDDATRELAEAAAQEGTVVTLDDVRDGRIPPRRRRREGEGGVAAAPVRSDGGPGADDEPWVAVWTSGTSGRPRGVLLSAANLAASAQAARHRLDLGEDDRWFLSLSPVHVGGLALVVRAAVLGCAIETAGRFDAEAFNRLADAGRVSHASLVPAMLRQVLDEREGRPFPASLRCLLLGGAHTPRPLVDRALAAGAPVAVTYGLTEASSQVATAPPPLVVEKPGTVGAPLRDVTLGLDESGEILLRGPTVALAYVGTGEPLVSPDGWLHTGDLGELDPEGHLWITGRLSDRIVTGGVNVDPAEVEDVLRLGDGVADAAVVGLPDEEWGEVVAAAVVKRMGSYPDPGELEVLARARLTTAKIPRRWLVLDALPRNPNGKVDRDELKALFLAGEEPVEGVRTTP